LGVLKFGRMYLGERFFEAEREREKTYEGVYSRYLAMGKSWKRVAGINSQLQWPMHLRESKANK